jgi:hypothetical protein
MAPSGLPPEPTELIYLPEPSWIPALAGVGLTLVFVGLFAGWVIGVIGALILVPALGRWISRIRKGVARLPRRQRSVAAVLPAVPMRRSDNR